MLSRHPVGELGAASEWSTMQNQCAIGVAHILFRANPILARRVLLKHVTLGNDAVFRNPARWAPAAVVKVHVDRRVERSPVDSRLAAGHNLAEGSCEFAGHTASLCPKRGLTLSTNDE